MIMSHTLLVHNPRLILLCYDHDVVNLILTYFSQSSENKVACRYDWHQTGPLVTISVFSKLAIPEKSWVEANRVSVKIFITFDGGKNVFEKHIVLRKVSA